MLSSFALACDTVFRRGLAFAGQLPPNAEVFGDGDGTVPITIQQGKKTLARVWLPMRLLLVSTNSIDSTSPFFFIHRLDE